MADDTENGFGSLITGLLNNAGPIVAGVGSYLNGTNNGRQYEQLGQDAANRADPFGDRSYYRDRLRASYDDPSAILNDPGHRISVQRGLDATGATNAAQGYLGSGRMLQELSKYASDSDATYLDAERGRLGNLAGAQFDPANAGRLMMEGGKLSLDAKNKALDALMTGLTMRGATGAGGGGLIDTISKMIQSGKPLPSNPPPGWSQSDWDTLKRNFTTNPNAPGGGGINGTGDGPAGPGFDAPGSGGDQYDWGDNIDQGGGWNPGSGGGPIGDVTSGGYTTVDWGNPNMLDFSSMDYGQFTDQDWSAFGDYFGILGE